MNNLDDINAMKLLDTVNVLGSIEQLGQQSKQAWDEVTALQFPDSYKKVTNVVFSGMGGSALGAYVVKSMYADTFGMPYEIVNDYNLPPYTNNQTLVILSSYSGSTEETVACAIEAVGKKAQVTGLTTGGKLAEILKSAGVTSYIYKPTFNPSGQPRLGSGYSVVGLLALFQNLGLVNVLPSNIDEIGKVLEKGNALYGASVLATSNRAKRLATAWIEKIPIIVSAQFLTHVGRVLRNQLHESAKSFAAYHEIPELNHHLMEGLSNPKTNKEILRFLFLSSPSYSEKIQKRLKITKDVVAKQGIQSEEFVPTASSRIAQAMECIQFGAYINYYMAMLYNVDPSKIPWVDYFKAELAK